MIRQDQVIDALTNQPWIRRSAMRTTRCCNYGLRFIKPSCVVLICLFVATSRAWALPDGFVYVDSVVKDVVVELRYHTANNFVGIPIAGYAGDRAILSRSAALALAKVQAELKAFGLAIKIFDAYRPQRAVHHFVRWARDTKDNRKKAEYYPNVDKRNLFKEKYIADRSGHSRGSTVDLTLVSLSPPKPLDMGTPFDLFGVESHPDYPKLTAQQRANRMLLRTIMMKHGFVPYPYEWWHFTLAHEPYPDTYFDFPVQ